MQDMKTVASYLSRCYMDTYGVRIDEMKLHKLMYFVQRESLVVNDRPIFEDANFEGWRFGPVLPALRELYKNDALHVPTDDIDGEDKAVMDAVLAEYAPSDSWNLSSLSHSEICWRRSRKGIAPSESSNNVIPLDDIRLDAARMKERRLMLQQQGLL